MNATFNIRNPRHIRLRLRAAQRLSARLFNGLPNVSYKINSASSLPQDYPWPSRAFIDCVACRMLIIRPMKAREVLQQRKKEIATWIKEPV